jgi:hypothetical protein
LISLKGLLFPKESHPNYLSFKPHKTSTMVKCPSDFSYPELNNSWQITQTQFLPFCPTCDHFSAFQFLLSAEALEKPEVGKTQLG